MQPHAGPPPWPPRRPRRDRPRRSRSRRRDPPRAARATASRAAPPARDDVLDHGDPLARLRDALQAVAGAVRLGGAAHDHERQAATPCWPTPRGPPRRAPAPRSAPRPARPRAMRSASAVAEVAQQVGPRLEAVLVQVERRAPPGAQQEVALQVRQPRARAGRAPPRTRRDATARPSVAGGEDLDGDGHDREGLRRVLAERQHRAVVEVEVDARAPAAPAAPQRDRADDRERSRGRTRPPYAVPSSPPSLAPPRDASTGSLAQVPQARLEVVEDQPDRGLRRPSRRRSGTRRRARRRRCPRRWPPRAARAAVGRGPCGPRSAASQSRTPASRDVAREGVVGDRRPRDRAVAAHDHGAVDLGRDLLQVGQRLRRVHGALLPGRAAP